MSKNKNTTKSGPFSDRQSEEKRKKGAALVGWKLKTHRPSTPVSQQEVGKEEGSRTVVVGIVIYSSDNGVWLSENERSLLRAHPHYVEDEKKSEN